MLILLYTHTQKCPTFVNRDRCDVQTLDMQSCEPDCIVSSPPRHLHPCESRSGESSRSLWASTRNVEEMGGQQLLHSTRLYHLLKVHLPQLGGETMRMRSFVMLIYPWYDTKVKASHSLAEPNSGEMARNPTLHFYIGHIGFRLAPLRT